MQWNFHMQLVILFQIGPDRDIEEIKPPELGVSLATIHHLPTHTFYLNHGCRTYYIHRRRRVRRRHTDIPRPSAPRPEAAVYSQDYRREGWPKAGGRYQQA
jgi:hypothetical protein